MSIVLSLLCSMRQLYLKKKVVINRFFICKKGIYRVKYYAFGE